MALSIIYEDNHLIAINKPPGLLVQGDRTGDESVVDLIEDYLRQKYNKPGRVFVGLIHRLDRPVSGILLIARTSKALTRMNKLFQQREVCKVYWAVITGDLPQDYGRLTNWLVKDRKHNKAKISKSQATGAKQAILDYRLLEIQGKRRLVRVEPITGRPHQIRIQLSAVECPIIGDRKYGHAEKPWDGAIALHAHSLTFVHPVKKEKLELRADPPDLPYWKNLNK